MMKSKEATKLFELALYAYRLAQTEDMKRDLESVLDKLRANIPDLVTDSRERRKFFGYLNFANVRLVEARKNRIEAVLPPDTINVYVKKHKI